MAYGFEPAKTIEEEYEITSSEMEGYKEYRIDFDDDESNEDFYGDPNDEQDFIEKRPVFPDEEDYNEENLDENQEPEDRNDIKIVIDGG